MQLRSRNEGFSLIELLVVITIIGILATVVVIRTQDVPKQANAAAAKFHLSQLETAVDRYYLDHASYPDRIEDLVQGPEHPVTGTPTSYLKVIPEDPWKHEPYEMLIDDQGRPYFVCYGEDGVEGGNGIHKDLYSNRMGQD